VGLPALCAEEDVLEGLLQTRLAAGRLRAPATRSADTLAVATGTAWRLVVVLAHRLQFPNPGVDRSPAHAQDPCDGGDPTETDLQRLDTSVATPMILRQRTEIQPHGFFVLLTVTWKFAHGDPDEIRRSHDDHIQTNEFQRAAEFSLDSTLGQVSRLLVNRS